jgi:hypothetical protein
MFIDDAQRPVLRNASSLSANDKVVDSPLADYLKDGAGHSGATPGRVMAQSAICRRRRRTPACRRRHERPTSRRIDDVVLAHINRMT